MELFNHTVRFVFDLLLAPLQTLSPSGSLLVLSVLFSLLLLLFFRLTTDQVAIRNVRRQMAAHLLEFRLFRKSLSIQWSALSRILLDNLKYFRYAGRPLLLMSLPVGLGVVHLNDWYGYEPLTPERTTLVAVKLSGEHVDLTRVRLEPSDGVAVVGQPLQIPHAHEINWSIRPERPGWALLTFLFQQERVQKRIIVSRDRLVRISRVTPARDSWESLWHPGERSLPKNSFAQRISVDYPARRLNLLGWEVHWVVPFLILSSLSALVFKRWLQVEI